MENSLKSTSDNKVTSINNNDKKRLLIVDDLGDANIRNNPLLTFNDQVYRRRVLLSNTIGFPFSLSDMHNNQK